MKRTALALLCLAQSLLVLANTEIITFRWPVDRSSLAPAESDATSIYKAFSLPLNKAVRKSLDYEATYVVALGDYDAGLDSRSALSRLRSSFDSALRTLTPAMRTLRVSFDAGDPSDFDIKLHNETHAIVRATRAGYVLPHRRAEYDNQRARRSVDVVIVFEEAYGGVPRTSVALVLLLVGWTFVWWLGGLGVRMSGFVEWVMGTKECKEE